MPQAVKIPDAKAAIENDKLLAWQVTHVKSKNEGNETAQKGNKDSLLSCADGLCST